MRKGNEVRLGPGDREQLETRNRIEKQPAEACLGARIVRLSVEGVGTMAI